MYNPLQRGIAMIQSATRGNGENEERRCQTRENQTHRPSFPMLLLHGCYIRGGVGPEINPYFMTVCNLIKKTEYLREKRICEEYDI
ncbi:hypothetical protein Y1Q_0007150 [Alligator mississippiensis]|uniref:Uncharacterized protein n=1 Tax=Alligator mississippiensis TaxID=8496 RepID=A0A151N618_ALLMI|nr:hypothetical protein Y1Q_0007150 [Alligator mississippiensis]